MAACTKCDFVFDPAIVPGGQCPRCLLLGVHEDLESDLRDEDDTTQTDTSQKRSVTEIDELAAELPGFELEERIGKGGMAVVWRARERVLDRHVAIKLVRNVEGDADFVERFTREARVMARLNHPNIVTLYSFGRTRSNHCYLVMELVEGLDLATVISQHGALEVPQALTIISKVCDALIVAHDAGFVHRDIKPGNVLLDHRGQVKVGDFGLARLARPLDPDTLSITKRGHAVGTPHYIAPEQAYGKGDEDHRADIYSLGIMLYEMLTGELPRGLFRLPSQKRKLDKRLDKVVLTALQEEPEKRYQTLAQLKADVHAVRVKIDPAIIAEQKAARYATRWTQRSQMALATAVAALLGIMCAWYAREWIESTSHSTPALAPVATLVGPAVKASTPQGMSVRPGSASGPSPFLKIIREVRLQPPTPPPGARFGRQVAVWRNWLVVAAQQTSRDEVPSAPGAVYVYQRDPSGVWQLGQRIDPPNPKGSRRFGYSIAMDAGRLAVGSPTTSQGGTSQIDLYRLDDASGQWLNDVSAGAVMQGKGTILGSVISLHGETIASCALNDSGQRGIALFQRDTRGQWLSTFLIPSRGGITGGCTLVNENEVLASLSNIPDEAGGADWSGGIMAARQMGKDWASEIVCPRGNPGIEVPSFFSLATDGRRVLAAAYRVGERSGIGWTVIRDADGTYRHESFLRPDPEAGACEFGKCVAIAGSYLAVGADHHTVDASHRGALHLYHLDESTGSWTRIRTLLADPTTGANDFGNSVAFGSQFIAVGAPRTYAPGITTEDETDAPGAVFIYEVEEKFETGREAK